MPTSPPAQWRRYLRFWRADVHADIDDEISFHIDARTRELIAEGLPIDVATARALREFGDVTRARDTLRCMDTYHAMGQRRIELVADLWQDVRIAVRSLSRSPGLVAVIVLTLALGIGLNSAVYSVVDAYLFRPLSVPNGRELVVLAQTEPTLAAPHEMSYPNYRDYQADHSIFADLAGFSTTDVSWTSGRGAERIWVQQVTANFFTVLGVRPALGQLFDVGDDQGELAHAHVVLSYAFWQSHFAGKPDVVGNVVHINNHPATIIGVAPKGFHGVEPMLDIDIFAPLNQLWPTLGPSINDRSATFMVAIGRLRAGLPLATAQTAVRSTAARLASTYPETNRDVGVVLVPETHARPAISVSTGVPAIAAAFMVLVLLVLTIACANVASLLLARAAAQHREHALRAALGASTWRLVRRALIECLILAGAGGTGALMLAAVALRALTSVRISADVPIRWDIALDGRVMVFTLVIVVLTALLAALAPAVTMSRTDLHDLLKAGARGSGGVGHQRLRSLLVVAQIAVCVVILSCAGLFARSTSVASHMRTGFRTDHLLMASTSLGSQGYDSLRGRQFCDDLLQRAGALPGVVSVALSAYVPFGYDNSIDFAFPEATPARVPVNGFGSFYNVVTPTYFETLGIPIIQGRAFTAYDDARSPRVAVVTRQFAATLWPGESAIGKRFHLGKGGLELEIVGVTDDIQYFSIGETPRPFFFRPYAQSYRPAMTLTVHTDQSPTSLASPLRETVASLDPNLPVFDVRTMEDHIANGRALLGTRIGTMFAEIFGLLAAALATVGVFGLISYSIAQRTREIGIRVALGAGAGSIVRLVVGQGLRIAAAGVVLGIGAALMATRLLAGLLYGVTPRDPLVLGSVAVALLVIAVVASVVPARLATRIDPIGALRAE